MTKPRLTLLATTPMHYQLPLYRGLAASSDVEFQCLFLSTEGIGVHDPGYGQGVTWDVDLVAGYPYRFLTGAETTPMRGGFFSNHNRNLLTTLRQLNPDILWLHGYNSLAHQQAAWFQKLRSKPLLVREEQTLLDRRSAWKRLSKQIGLRAMFSQATALYIGSNNRQWFAHYGIPPQRMHHVPYIVDNQKFQELYRTLSNSKQLLQESFGISSSGPVISTVSRLIPKKQVLHLLQAFSRVRAATPCSLLIAGSGPEQHQLEAFAQLNRIPDVHFVGFVNQSQVARVYAASDVFALVSGWDETWGLVVNEAMNFSLPIISTDKVGCAVDLVIPGYNGEVVSSLSVSQLASALCKLVADRDLRTSYGANSFTRISSWDATLAIDGVLQAVASVRSHPQW